MAALNDRSQGQGRFDGCLRRRGRAHRWGKFIESLEMVLHVANVGDAKLCDSSRHNDALPARRGGSELVASLPT
jgi:hypothetical protein